MPSLNNWPRILSLAWIAWMVSGPPAQAIVVYKKGSSQPLMGHLVRQDDRMVTMREELPDGKSRVTAIPRGEIDELIETVSAQRLAALDPAESREYRDYAEELAEKKADPEARDLAIRLYLIAAHLGRAGNNRGALLGLIALARNPQEKARFRALAYLEDDRHDSRILKAAAYPAPPVAPAAKAIRAGATDDLRNALRAARRGKGGYAKSLSAKSGVAELFTLHHEVLSSEEFDAICGAKSLSEGQLRKLLQLELALDDPPGEPAPLPLAQPVIHWTATPSGGLAPVRPLRLETLTEFDPRASLFRNGAWVRPPAR